MASEPGGGPSPSTPGNGPQRWGDVLSSWKNVGFSLNIYSPLSVAGYAGGAETSPSQETVCREGEGRAATALGRWAAGERGSHMVCIRPHQDWSPTSAGTENSAKGRQPLAASARWEELRRGSRGSDPQPTWGRRGGRRTRQWREARGHRGDHHGAVGTPGGRRESGWGGAGRPAHKGEQPPQPLQNAVDSQHSVPSPHGSEAQVPGQHASQGQGWPAGPSPMVGQGAPPWQAWQQPPGTHQWLSQVHPQQAAYGGLYEQPQVQGHVWPPVHQPQGYYPPPHTTLRARRAAVSRPLPGLQHPLTPWRSPNSRRHCQGRYGTRH